MASSSGVMYEGWMVRHGRRKIGRSFIHMRYFVLEPRLLSYYKRKPQHKDEAGGGKLPIKSLHIDGNCRVEDRGLNMHHGRVSSSPIRNLLFVPLSFPTMKWICSGAAAADALRFMCLQQKGEASPHHGNSFGYHS
jgi:hypothetical protein